MKEFAYEGKLLHTAANRQAIASPEALEEARRRNSVLEAECYLCDQAHALHVKLGTVEGIIPREEGALSRENAPLKDIALISKVGKPVQFAVQELFEKDGRQMAKLSRKQAQQQCVEQYISLLACGDVIEARVTHLESFGAFVDIGAGINSLIPIDMLSVSRISHPRKRVKEGEVLRCVLRNKQADKLTLSLRELLGTWEENAAAFSAGQTVRGVVRSVESYGVFIELAPNLAGLAEYSDALRVGEAVSVYIKSIIPEKMKIKLSVIERLGEEKPAKLKYFTQAEHISYWRYSPLGCGKVIETVF